MPMRHCANTIQLATYWISCKVVALSMTIRLVQVIKRPVVDSESKSVRAEMSEGLCDKRSVSLLCDMVILSLPLTESVEITAVWAKHRRSEEGLKSPPSWVNSSCARCAHCFSDVKPVAAMIYERTPATPSLPHGLSKYSRSRDQPVL